MSQRNSKRKVKKHQQMAEALELRAAGASFRQIAEALCVSKPRAFRIVRAALNELVEHCHETAERVRCLELHRLDRIRQALDPNKSDPRVADTLIRISDRVAKLHGLDSPARIEVSGPGEGPIQTQENPVDFSTFSLDELLIFEALRRKAESDPKWDENIRYYGTEEHLKQSPGKPPGLITLFARGLLPEQIRDDG